MGALIKFGRENGSQPKVWITFLFDELSRLTTGNGDIKLVRRVLLTKIEFMYKSLRLLLHCTGLPKEGSLQKLRLAGPGSWPYAKEI